MESAERIPEVTAHLRVKYGQRFAAFVTTHVQRLLRQGPRAIQHAYRTKARTIVEHEGKLARAQEAAGQGPTQESLGLARYYEKEIARLRTEHAILREAMEMMGISVP